MCPSNAGSSAIGANSTQFCWPHENASVRYFKRGALRTRELACPFPSAPPGSHDLGFRELKILGTTCAQRDSSAGEPIVREGNTLSHSKRAGRPAVSRRGAYAA